MKINIIYIYIVITCIYIYYTCIILYLYTYGYPHSPLIIQAAGPAEMMGEARELSPGFDIQCVRSCAAGRA